MTSILHRTPDDAKLQFLRDHGADGAAHSGLSLIDHLIGTWRILCSWGVPPFVCDAGLFHSIYGTGTYHYALTVNRGALQAVIGADAERLVHGLSRLRESDIWEWLDGGSQPIARGTASAQDERSPGDPEMLWILHLLVANELEQAGRGWQPVLAMNPAVVRRLLPAAQAHLGLTANDQGASTDIGRLLTWSEPLTLVEEVAHSYEWSMRLEVERAVMALASAYPEIVELWKRLPLYLQQELFRAPETGYRLQSGTGMDATRFITESIVALQRAHGTPTGFAGPSWTPGGDQYTPDDRSGVEAAYDAARFDPHLPYRAVRCGSIVVDFFSPYAASGTGVDDRSDRAHTPDEARVVLERVERALTLLYDTAWQAATFVDLSLRSVALRADPGAFVPASGSWRTMVGKAVLLNQHADECTPATVADSLLHEAVHAFLYRYERLIPLFRTQPDDGVAVMSPWTGASLSVPSFTHACLVWFALWNLWRRAMIVGSAPVESVAPLLARAASGFQGRPLVEVSGAARHWSPELLALVDACQSQVQRS